MPNNEASPHTGEAGKLEEVDEVVGSPNEMR